MKILGTIVMTAGALGLAMLGWTQLPPSAAVKRPVYEVSRTSAPIKIDGVLDDPAWTRAPLVGPFCNCRDGSPAALPTEARIVYDDHYIYFATRFVDENIQATMKNRDEHLWEEEVMEVFIKPFPASPHYIELEVNPLGALLDIFLMDVRRPLHYASWNSEKIKWAVHVNGAVDGQPGDREWTCELAFPFEDAGPQSNMDAPAVPTPGTRWRLNLFRVEKLPRRAALAWSPTGNDFHCPERFGEIVFTEKTP